MVPHGTEMTGINTRSTTKVRNEPLTDVVGLNNDEINTDSEYFSDTSDESFQSAKSHLEDNNEEEENPAEKVFNVKEVKIKKNKQLNVCYSNVDRNIFKKIEPYKTFVDNNNVGIWAVAEPTIPENANPPEIVGFKCEKNFQHRLIVYHKEKLELKVSKIESTVPMVMLQGRDTTWVFLYSEFTTEGDFNPPKERCQKIMQSIGKNLHLMKKKCHIMGDLNFNLNKLKNDVQVRNLKNYLEKKGFSIHETGNTRKGKKGQEDTRIDWYCTRKVTGEVSTHDFGELSDHKTLLWTGHKPNPQEVTSEVEIFKFGEEAKSWALENDPRLKLTEDTSMEEIIEQLNDFCNGVMEAGKKKLKIRKWGCKYYTKELEDMRIDMENTKNPAVRKAKSKQYAYALRVANKEYKRKQAQQKGHPYEPNDRQNIEGIVILNDDNTVKKESFDPEEQAEEFQKTWKESVEKLTKNNKVDKTEVLDRFKRRHAKIAAENPTMKTWTINPPKNVNQTRKFVMKLKSKKSAGTDGISINLIKKVIDFVQDHLHRLIVLSITTGVFPKELKEVVLTPVFKKGKKPNEAASYRPVALAKSFGRILDAYANREVTNALNKMGILQDSVHGYRKNHSTGSMVHDIVNSAQTLKSKPKNNVLYLGLDFSKAYDCVDKFLCVDILRTIGADEKTCKWILDFLQDRYLMVKVKDKLSKGYCPDYGILQGSSLSPTLFALISSDLIEALGDTVAKVCMYADDSCAIIEYKTRNEGIQKVKKASRIIDEWARAIGLSVNKSKSEYMSLTNEKMTIDEIEILGETVKNNNTLTLVGVTIDKKFNFNEMTEKMIKKINSKVYKMKCSAFGHSVANKRILYLGYVYGTVLAGADSWLPYTSKGNIKKLQAAMRRGLRYVVGMKPYGNLWYDGTKFSASKEERRIGVKNLFQIQKELQQLNSVKHFDRIFCTNTTLKSKYDVIDLNSRVNDSLLTEVTNMKQAKTMQKTQFASHIAGDYDLKKRMKTNASTKKADNGTSQTKEVVDPRKRSLSAKIARKTTRIKCSGKRHHKNTSEQRTDQDANRNSGNSTRNLSNAMPDERRNTNQK